MTYNITNINKIYEHIHSGQYVITIYYIEFINMLVVNDEISTMTCSGIHEITILIIDIKYNYR